MAKKTSPNTHLLLEGSFRGTPEGSQLQTLNPSETIEVTVRIRRKQSVEKALAEGKQISHEEYETKYGASAQDIEAVSGFASTYHLSIASVDVARRSVNLTGTIKNFEEAFKIHLSNYTDHKGNLFRARVGHISIPASLSEIIEGVFGFDTRPAATPKIRNMHGHRVIPHSGFQGYAPNEVAKAYGFPAGTGEGQTIALIELGGGYKMTDIQNYFKSLKLPVPVVSSVSVNGGANNPTGNPNGADGEVVLDIEVAGAVAPKAKIVAYFAPNTTQGFLNAITAAVHDKVNKPSVISISWGAAEPRWNKQSMKSYDNAFQTAALLGITVTVASGDNGSGDQMNDTKVHVDFPASSPHVLACGGTKLDIGNLSAEEVWNEEPNYGSTGGGVSEFFPVPAYQLNAKIPASLSTKFKGRGVPDVAGNADPVTGYKVRVDGLATYIGGTSAVAPLMAGLIARVNQVRGSRVGFVNPTLYKNPSKFCRDITKGDNTSNPPGIGYTAGPGWDGSTGLGVLHQL